MADVHAPRELRRDAVRNQRELLRAATAAVHREGLRVPLGTIAADAGVGIGTLYRHFPTRADLLNRLTHESFEQVLSNAEAALREGTDPIDRLRRFVEAAIAQRNELVLPLHGGPAVTAPATVAVRSRVHAVLRQILEDGVQAGTVRTDVTPGDIVAFGALLAQPRTDDRGWDATCRRLLATYLRGIAP